MLGFKYCGNSNSYYFLFDFIIGIAALKCILHTHNLPTSGSKDELVVNVCLLRAGREGYINKNKRKQLLDLVKIAQLITSKEIAIKSVRCCKKRRFSTDQEPKLSSIDPRKSASSCETFTKSKIKVPVSTRRSNLHDIFNPLKQDLQAMNGITKESETSKDADTGEEVIDEDQYEQFFEIGVRVEIRWTKVDVSDSGWRPGWFVAEVQDFNLDNDWIKVEYTREEGKVYKVNVRQDLGEGILRLKDSIFNQIL